MREVKSDKFKCNSLALLTYEVASAPDETYARI